MRRLALLAAAGLAVLATSGADARTIVHPDPSPRAHLYQPWVNRAHVPTPAAVVPVRADMGACGEWRTAFGCANMSGPVEIVVRPLGARRGFAERSILYHELGHVFDRLHLSDGDRAWFTRRLKVDAAADWWAEPTGWAPLGVRLVPGEAFADLYAMCAEYPRRFLRYRGGTDEGYGWWPRRTVLAGCARIERVYGRAAA